MDQLILVDDAIRSGLSPSNLSEALTNMPLT
jgi:hypothetical protein